MNIDMLTPWARLIAKRFVHLENFAEERWLASCVLR